MRQNISLQQLVNELDFTIRQCENISPILHEVGNLAKNEAELSFEKESSPFGDKWTPLSQQTLKNKRGSKILTESSLLQSSINSRVNMQSALYVFKNNSDTNKKKNKEFVRLQKQVVIDGRDAQFLHPDLQKSAWASLRQRP